MPLFWSLCPPPPSGSLRPCGPVVFVCASGRVRLRPVGFLRALIYTARCGVVAWCLSWPRPRPPLPWRLRQAAVALTRCLRFRGRGLGFTRAREEDIYSFPAGKKLGGECERGKRQKTLPPEKGRTAPMYFEGLKLRGNILFNAGTARGVKGGR